MLREGKEENDFGYDEYDAFLLRDANLFGESHRQNS